MTVDVPQLNGSYEFLKNQGFTRFRTIIKDNNSLARAVALKVFLEVLILTSSQNALINIFHSWTRILVISKFADMHNFKMR